MNPHTPAHQRQVFLDLNAAVDYLAATRRPDLTIETAIVEAIRRHIATHHLGRPTQWGFDDDEWFTHAAINPNDPDPLKTALTELADITPNVDLPHGHTIGTELINAIDAWTNTMSHEHNRSWPWTHPAPVQAWNGPPDTSKPHP